MAEALIIGVVVVGGVLVVALLQEDETVTPANGSVSSKKRVVGLNREFGYTPSISQPPTNTNRWDRMIPRLKRAGGEYDPASIADIYTSAYAQKSTEAAAEALQEPDHSVVISKGTGRLPLFTPLSAEGQGAMGNYPLSWFESDSNQDPIETRQDIFTDKVPSTFPGPARAMYPLASAPDRLRSPWGLDGRFARDVQQARRPTVPTRPKSNRKNPHILPVAQHPWSRRISDNSY